MTNRLAYALPIARQLVRSAGGRLRPGGLPARRCDVRTAFLLLVILTALTVGLSTINAQAAPHTFTIGALSLQVGDDGSVVLEAVNVTEPVTAWDLKIVYDPQVVSLVECTSVGNSVCDPDFRNNAVRVLGVSDVGLDEDFPLATITFQCQRGGSSPLSLISQLLTVGLDPSPKTQDGVITCQEAPEPTATDEVGPTATAAPVLPDTGSDGRAGGAIPSWLIAALSGFGVLAAALGLRQAARRR